MGLKNLEKIKEKTLIKLDRYMLLYNIENKNKDFKLSQKDKITKINFKLDLIEEQIKLIKEVR